MQPGHRRAGLAAEEVRSQRGFALLPAAQLAVPVLALRAQVAAHLAPTTSDEQIRKSNACCDTDPAAVRNSRVEHLELKSVRSAEFERFVLELKSVRWTPPRGQGLKVQCLFLAKYYIQSAH